MSCWRGKSRRGRGKLGSLGAVFHLRGRNTTASSLRSKVGSELIGQPAQISVLGNGHAALGSSGREPPFRGRLPLILKHWRLVYPCDGCLHCRLCDVGL
jgi:hypothetical protein